MRHACLILALAGCSTPPLEDELTAPSHVSLAVGVTCDPELEPQVAKLSLSIATPREVQSTSWERRAFPFEVMLDDLMEDDTVDVTAVAEATDGVLVTRSARTLAVAGEPLLLRMQLNDECIPASSVRDVSCPGQTCIAGLCEESYVSPSELEPYHPDWAVPPADACAPSPGARADVTLGQDGEPFVPLEPGTVLTPEWGPQGGTHVWLAIRMRGLTADSTTMVWADFPTEDIEGSVQRSTARYLSSCELFSFRYVLPMSDAWDTPMHLTAVVVDPSGHAGHQYLDVNVSHPAN